MKTGAAGTPVPSRSGGRDGPPCYALTMADLEPSIQRIALEGLSPAAFEHPADRAALHALRKLPGFDVMLRAVIGLIGERSVRYMHLANAVRVGPDQFARIDEIYEECLRTLDVQVRPELFIAQTPIVNAGAVGVDQPFIVLNSGTLHLFDDDEIRFIIGHELGHVLADHSLYKTMLALLLRVSFGSLGIPVASIALFAIVAALREWDRKSELSGDRAGLLAVQDPEVAYRVQMKMAGGGTVSEMSVEAFEAQARDYEQGGGVLDGVVKLMNLLQRTHPFSVLRLTELKRWVDSGDYQRTLDGEYPRRGEGEQPKLAQDLLESARSYRDAYRDSKDPFARFVQGISDAGTSALGRARELVRPGKD